MAHPTAHLLCRKCGYDLRGLDVRSNCPECGLSIESSLLVERMADAPASWVRAQRAGTWMLFSSYALAAFAILGEVFAPYVEGIPKPVFVALRLIPLALLAAAVWLLTIQRKDRRPKKASLLVRWGFVAVLALSVLIPIAKHGGLETIWARLGLLVFFTLLVVCWIGLGCVQIRIARMLDASWLAPILWTASILWSAGLLLTAAFYVFREFTGRYLFLRSETGFVALLLVGGVMLVFSSALVASRFRRLQRS